VAWWVYDQYFRKAKKKHNTTLTMSHIGSKQMPVSWKVKLMPYIPILPVIASVSLLIALSKPRIPLAEESIKGQGIDIMISIDVSLSMLARDFKPDRLEAAKSVAAEFVSKRKSDKIGLVIFSGESFTQCPLTIDNQIVMQYITSIQPGLLKDGTAIGMGLAAAVNRLRDSEAKSRVAILMTDGVNNAGDIDPVTAMELAKQLGVKVYTIGIGTTGYAETPAMTDPLGNIIYRNVAVKIDEELLKQISNATGGKYFRAVDLTSLSSIYDEIDRLEKSDIDTNVLRSYKYLFRPLLVIALLIILLWWIIKLLFYTQAFETEEI
jgi:Ca-activated chloride channel homolog